MKIEISENETLSVRESGHGRTREECEDPEITRFVFVKEHGNGDRTFEAVGSVVIPRSKVREVVEALLAFVPDEPKRTH